MKSKETDEVIDEVVVGLCRECKVEAFYNNGSLDMDGYWKCPKCEKTDFIGEQKFDVYKKITSITTEVTYKKL